MDQDTITRTWNELQKRKPKSPEKGRLLFIPAKDLSHEEVLKIVSEFDRYEAEKSAYALAMNAWARDSSEWWLNIRAELAHDFNIIGHPKEPKVWEKAVDESISDIYNIYEEFTPFLTVV